MYKNLRVLAQVSCEIQQPKASRPSEGILNINLELTPLGAPNFEAGRQSELSVQLNRLLEKGLKDSKAVDLESLCIKVNEKVKSSIFFDIFGFIFKCCKYKISYFIFNTIIIKEDLDHLCIKQKVC